jgi:hypothetical protein
MDPDGMHYDSQSATHPQKTHMPIQMMELHKDA